VYPVGIAAAQYFGLAATHPYAHAYLPVNRLEDGTFRSW
jgi:hypothetical protein